MSCIQLPVCDVHRRQAPVMNQSMCWPCNRSEETWHLTFCGKSRGGWPTSDKVSKGSTPGWRSQKAASLSRLSCCLSWLLSRRASRRAFSSPASSRLTSSCSATGTCVAASGCSCFCHACPSGNRQLTLHLGNKHTAFAMRWHTCDGNPDFIKWPNCAVSSIARPTIHQK